MPYLMRTQKNCLSQTPIIFFNQFTDKSEQEELILYKIIIKYKTY